MQQKQKQKKKENMKLLHLDYKLTCDWKYFVPPWKDNMLQQLAIFAI